MLTNLAQTGLTTADVILMSRLGPEAVAAGALGTNLLFAFLIFGFGVVTATAPLMAQELGRRRHSVRDVRRTVRQGFWTSAMLAVPMGAVLWHAEPILLALGQDRALAAVAGPYVQALMWGILPAFLLVVLRCFLAAVERPMWTLGTALLALPANVGLAWWLMFGGLGVPALGLVGAGVATSLIFLFMFLALAAVVSFDRRLRRYRLFGRFWRGDPARLRTVLRIGVPIGGTMLFEVGLFNAAALVIGLFGAPALAAHAVALQIAALNFMVPLGLAQAVTVRVGLAFGAGDFEAVRRAGWTAFALAVGFMLLIAIVLVLMPETLVSAFLDPSEPANRPVIDLAVTFLAFAALFAIADGAQAIGAGMLRGLQDTRVPMLYAALGYWGIGASLGLGLAFWARLDGVGIWIGLSTGLAVVALLLIDRWRRRDELGLMRPASVTDAVRPLEVPQPV